MSLRRLRGRAAVAAILSGAAVFVGPHPVPLAGSTALAQVGADVGADGNGVSAGVGVGGAAAGADVGGPSGSPGGSQGRGGDAAAAASGGSASRGGASSGAFSFNFGADATSKLTKAASFLADVQGGSESAQRERTSVETIMGQLGGYRNALVAGDLYAAAHFLSAAVEPATISRATVHAVNSRLGINLTARAESELTSLAKDQD